MPLVERDVEQWAAGGVLGAIILKQQAEKGSSQHVLKAAARGLRGLHFT